MMRSHLTSRAFGMLLLLIIWQMRATAGELVPPAKDDPRAAKLDTVKLEAMKFDKVSVEDFCDEVELAQHLGSVVLRGEMKDLRLSLQFPGGTLRSLLEQVAKSAPITIRFEKLAMAITRNEVTSIHAEGMIAPTAHSPQSPPK